MTDHDRTVLALVADPGLPTELARRLADELPQLLGGGDNGGADRWEVRLSDRRIALDENGALPTVKIGDRARRSEDADAVVLITDLPRRAGRNAVVADAGTAQHVGLVSLPALGALNQYRRCRDTIVELVTVHLLPSAEPARSGPLSGSRRGGALVRLDPGHDRDRDDESGSGGVEDEVDLRLALTGQRGRLRLLSGLVRANRPWRLVPSLSPAIAAAAAGAAFGIFYSNIWQLATALGTGRQILVTLIALVGMTTWLIADNGLWETRRIRSLREEMLLSNVSTVLTVATGVVIMYALLFVLTLCAAALVIPPDYLGSTLMRATGPGDYVQIAWLATSMGTIAGALGSGFADEDAVRQAAYSRREQERRARLDSEEDDRDSGTE